MNPCAGRGFPPTALKHAALLNTAALSEKTDPDWEFDYIDIGGVEANQGVVSKQRLRFADAPSRARRKVQNGDVIISTVRTYLKAVARIEAEHEDAIVSTGFAVLTPRQGVHSGFLAYAMHAEEFLFQVVRESTGVSYPAINPETLGRIKLGLPDLATQKSIADFLDRETARIDGLIGKKRQQVELIRTRERRFITTLLENIHAPRWRLRHLGRLRNGAGFPVDLQGNSSKEVPFFKVKHLQVHGLDARIEASDDTVDRETARGLGATIFPSGTIVFAKIGAALLLGRFSMLGREACIDNNMSAFISDASLVDPDFLLLALMQIDTNLLVQPGAVPSMNTQAFYDCSSPLPPLTEQRGIVDKARTSTRRDASLIGASRKSIDRLSELRSALITAAVAGRIDPAKWHRRGGTERALDRIAAEVAE